MLSFSSLSKRTVASILIVVVLKDFVFKKNSSQDNSHQQSQYFHVIFKTLIPSPFVRYSPEDAFVLPT